MSKNSRRNTGISRRRFLRDVGLATVASAHALAQPGLTQTLGRPPSRRQTVAVFGGGIAGLTAAHELAERGFDVTVYERRAWGGKARSTEVPGSATDGRKPLPGEHGYRAEFGCYQNLPDTMKRIPFGSNPNGVFDNMVAAPGVLVAREGKHDLVLPLASLDPRPYSPQQILDLLLGVLVDMQVRPDAAAYLVNRLLVFFSSCDARRLGQWERKTWRDFIGGDRFGADYQAIFERVPEFTQASKGSETSAKYVAWVLEIWFLQAILGRGTNGPTVRILNRPTNEAWIDPWIAHLSDLGVNLRLSSELVGLDVANGRIAAARILESGNPNAVMADYYVCALPVERARELWTPDVLAADPKLGLMNGLGVAWYNGISYFLRERSRIIRGHVLCPDSPWAASFIPQAQFWSGDFATKYGDGSVHDKISAVVADWDAPGIVFGKPARQLSPDEVAIDLWEQLKLYVNEPGRTPLLTDEMLHSWEIDPGMVVRDDRLVSEDALILPTAGTEQYRPDAVTAIGNLMLCGDYLNGRWETTNMEAACFNGRRAANAILDAAGSNHTPAAVIDPYRPPEWKPLQAIDDRLYRAGQPNLFDVASRPLDWTAKLLRLGGL